MPVPAAPPTDFSWINTSTSDRATPSNRRRVMQHVHRYRRTQRRQDAQRLLQSSLFRQPGHGGGDRPPREQAPPAVAEPSTAIVAPSIPRPIYIPPIIELMLVNSGSDDTDALSRASMSAANSLLFFERDCVYPAAKQLEWATVPKDRAFETSWESDLQKNLYDNLTIHSYLSRIAATLSWVTGNVQYLDTAKTLRSRGVVSLRHHLETTRDVNIPRLYRSLISLLFAESAVNDRATMKIHIRLLRDVFLSHHDKLLQDPSINHHVFMSIIWQDVQFAVWTMSPTFFDLSPNEWISRLVQPIWSSQPSLTSAIEFETENSLRPFFSKPVRSMLVAVDHVLQNLVNVRANNFVGNRDTWVYFLSKFVFAAGRLVNHVVATRAQLSQPGHTPNSRLNDVHEVCASLCAIFWIRESMGSENIYLSPNLRIWMSNPIILQTIRQTFQLIYLDESYWEQDKSQDKLELLLWMLWPGCFADTGERNWFIEKIGLIMNLARIQTWPHFWQTLHRFVVPATMVGQMEECWTSLFSPRCLLDAQRASTEDSNT